MWKRSQLKPAFGDSDLDPLSRARALIAVFVAYYNEQRLHAGLGYLTPADFYCGDPGARRADRTEN